MMISNETTHADSGDIPNALETTKSTDALEAVHENGHGPLNYEANKEHPREKISSDHERDLIDKLENGLGSLKIDSSKESKSLLEDSKTFDRDLSKDIVITPVELKPDRTLRTSVVLISGNKRDIRPGLGKYTIEGRYLRPARVDKWVMVILFDKLAVEDLAKGVYSFEDVKSFSENYVQVARSKGIQITPLASIMCIPRRASPEENVETISSDDLKQELQHLFIKLNDCLVEHAIIILPDSCPSWIHGYLQYLETCRWGTSKNPGVDKLTRTSRMRFKTLIDLGFNSRCGGKQSLIPSLLLKYNAKLGGVNVALKRTFDTHEMKFLDEGYMILSIDMYDPCHEAQTVFTPISVAVGMWDLASAQMAFHTQTRVQLKDVSNQGQTVAVADLDKMLKQIILSYKERKNGKTPSNVIVFRCGAYRKNDGHDSIAAQEIAMIKQAFRDESSGGRGGGGEPILTYLRVPKVEKIRKYEGIPQVSAARPENRILTGSLVDSIITAVSEEEQQQQQQVTIVRPSGERSRANVFKLYDEANLQESSIQKMIFALSFLSPRVAAKTRPTPIDLADLAGERSHNIVRAWMEDHKMGVNDGQLLEKVNEFLAIKMGDKDYKNALYYA